MERFKESEIPPDKQETLFPVYSSIFNQFLEFHGLNLSSPVGEEIYDENKLGDYFEKLTEKYQSGTIPGIKSKLKKIREFAIKLSYNNEIQKLQFGESLSYVLKQKNMCGSELAELVGLEHRPGTISDWTTGRSIPSFQSLNVVAEIERVLEIPSGILKAKLGKVIHGQKCELFKNRERTEQGIKTQELKKYPYRLNPKEFSQDLQKELEDLIFFYTDDRFKNIDPSLKRTKKQRWGTKKGKCGTGKLLIKNFSNYCGFLTGALDNPEELQRGLGLSVDELSITLLLNPDFISKYLQFRHLRLGKVTNGTKQVLIEFQRFCRPKYGYLRQRPDLGKKYFTINDSGLRVYPYKNLAEGQSWTEEWNKICDKTDEFFQEELEAYTFEPLTDNFKQIEKIADSDIMEEIKNILSWQKYAADMKGLPPHCRAMRQRDYILSLLLFLFELRIDHYALMEFDRHLYKENGAWKLKIFKIELKRPEVLKSEFVVLEIPEDVGHIIEEYQKKYRPLLYCAKSSKKVFLGSVTGRKNGKSVDGIEARSLSFAFKNMMTLYSKSETGFAAHAVRKLVSSVLDRKRDLSDFDVSATMALHSREVSRSSYTAGQVQAAFKHYVHRLQQAGILKMPEGQKREIKVDEENYNNLLLKNQEMERILIQYQNRYGVLNSKDDDKELDSISA